MIHHVFANRSNIGDWLSARGIQRLLAPQTVVEHLCDRPFVEETLRQLKTADPRDFIVIGGGGLFMDYFEPFWRGFRDIAQRIPFCIWGVGYCDLKRERTCPPIDLLREIIAQSRLAVVRDELTRRHLGCSELPDPVPCPSVYALEPDRATGRGLLHVDNYTTAGAAAYKAMERCGRQFADETNRPFLKSNNRITPGSRTDLDNVLGRYARCDLVLTSALHGCIIALAMGRRVLAVSGDRKIESVMQAAGLGDWVLDLEELDHLPRRLMELPRQAEATRFLQSAREANEGVAERLLRLTPPLRIS